jgi:hypothetical protein
MGSSDFDILYVFFLLFIWIFSPVSITIAAILLLVELFAASFVKGTGHDIDHFPVPPSKIHPIFQNLKLNNFCRFFDALYLNNITSLAGVAADLKTRGALCNIKEAVIRHIEYSLQLAENKLIRRESALFDAEAKFKQWEADLAFQNHVLLIKEKRAQNVINADCRKRMKAISSMDLSFYSDKKQKNRKEKEKRMKNVISDYNTRFANDQEGDLKFIRLYHESKHFFNANPATFNKEEAIKAVSSLNPLTSALPILKPAPVTRPATPALKKTNLLYGDPPKGELRKKWEPPALPGTPKLPDSLVFGSFAAAEAIPVVSVAPVAPRAGLVPSRPAPAAPRAVPFTPRDYPQPQIIFSAKRAMVKQ